MFEKKSIRKLFALVEEELNFELAERESYKEAISRRKSQAEIIENCMSKGDFELLQEYLEIENEVGSIEMEEAFVKGFSIAYKLLIDSLR